MLRVMVTQTWSWFHAQLDYPRSRWIKVHILKDGERYSYCGLENRTDEGEVTLQEFLNLGDDACKKCLTSYAVNNSGSGQAGEAGKE